MATHWLLFQDGPRDGESARFSIVQDRNPPDYWRHVTTIDQPLHVYRRQQFQLQAADGRWVWVYDYIGKSTRPAHRFSMTGDHGYSVTKGV